MKAVVGFLAVSGFAYFLSADPWVVLAIFIVGLGYFLSGLWTLILFGLALIEKFAGRAGKLRYSGKKR